jgi:hypothetical protein
MDKRAVIESYWQAEHDRNLERVLSHYGNEAEIITPSGCYQGRAEIADYYVQIFQTYRQVTVTIKQTFESKAGIAAEYSCELIAPDGAVKVARGCNVFSLQEDEITSLRCYFDPSTF